MKNSHLYTSHINLGLMQDLMAKIRTIENQNTKFVAITMTPDFYRAAIHLIKYRIKNIIIITNQIEPYRLFLSEQKLNDFAKAQESIMIEEFNQGLS